MNVNPLSMSKEAAPFPGRSFISTLMRENPSRPHAKKILAGSVGASSALLAGSMMLRPNYRGLPTQLRDATEDERTADLLRAVEHTRVDEAGRLVHPPVVMIGGVPLDTGDALSGVGNVLASGDDISIRGQVYNNLLSSMHSIPEFRDKSLRSPSVVLKDGSRVPVNDYVTLGSMPQIGRLVRGDKGTQRQLGVQVKKMMDSPQGQKIVADYPQIKPDVKKLKYVGIASKLDDLKEWMDKPGLFNMGSRGLQLGVGAGTGAALLAYLLWNRKRRGSRNHAASTSA